MPVTLMEIAQAAGVSVSTVSRVLNNTDHSVAEATRDRIRDLANQMGYRPNLLARGLQARRTSICGIIVDNIASDFAPPIVRSIQDRLKTSGYSTTIINSDFNQQIEQDAIYTLLSFPVDGIILVDTWLHTQRAEMPQTGKPYVFVNRIFSGQAGAELCMIEPDDYNGALTATRHLLSLGHQRVAFINGPPNWKAARERLKGYRDALAEHGLSLDPDMVETGAWTLPSGYTTGQKLLALPNRPTAIFAGNDQMAVGVIYAAQDAGLRVPSELAVVGYDNRPEATIVRPNLTTITMPLAEMGLAAAELFLGCLFSKQVEPGVRRLQGRLIVRDSCGSPRPSKPEPPSSNYDRFTIYSQMALEEENDEGR